MWPRDRPNFKLGGGQRQKSLMDEMMKWIEEDNDKYLWGTPLHKHYKKSIKISTALNINNVEIRVLNMIVVEARDESQDESILPSPINMFTCKIPCNTSN